MTKLTKEKIGQIVLENIESAELEAIEELTQAITKLADNVENLTLALANKPLARPIQTDIISHSETVLKTQEVLPATPKTKKKRVVEPVVEPVVESTIASFVDQSKDPQSYVDRYNNEEAYKEWFDSNYSQYSSIYQAVGLEEPEIGICGPGTLLNPDGVCEIIVTESIEKEGGGCLIATATYGSELAPQVQMLREIRDNQLMNTESGKSFMSGFNELYYSFSPTIADMERESPVFKEIVKAGLTPMLSTLTIMESAETESEVLGLGLSVIVLNLGMYVGLPVIGIVKLYQIKKQ